MNFEASKNRPKWEFSALLPLKLWLLRPVAQNEFTSVLWWCLSHCSQVEELREAVLKLAAAEKFRSQGFLRSEQNLPKTNKRGE